MSKASHSPHSQSLESQSALSKKSQTSQTQVSQVHTALYRKYRPAMWAEVIGQDHIVQSLQAEVAKVSGGTRPHHAYLFAGTRGTGKTTIARIFAAEIGTAPEDIYEIDAASNTSVEDIRVLTEGVHALPLMSAYKVYILDEVHMLSKSAFNAFLKTLEEPPKHVIFILATTELHKIPETIISRCQVFHFNTPAHETLAEVIIAVAKKEGVTLSPQAAQLVATVARGSFRDALSALQGVVARALSGGVQGSNKSAKQGTDTDLVTLEIEEVEQYLSVPSQVLVQQFVDIVISAGSASTDGAGSQGAGSELELSLKTGFSILGQVHRAHHNPAVFAEYLMTRLREVLIEHNGIGAEAVKAARMLGILLELVPSIGKTYIGILPLELALMRFFEVK
jgi:Holliday junction resolvasome RuvABC ATP-dependent DNA helicase subunit